MAERSRDLIITEKLAVYIAILNFRFSDGGFGGQALHVTGDVVLAYKTQDAGKTNTYCFIGPNCGGTGWIMFDVNVP